MVVAHDVTTAPQPPVRPFDPFSTMSHTLTASPRVTDAEYRLIGAIKRHDWRDGICRASQAELADHCDKDERTVRRLIASLKDKGLLVEENDPDRAGRARVYRLIGIATTTPQTGQLWPVYSAPDPAPTGHDCPDELANPGQLKRPNLAGLKKTPEDTGKRIPELQQPGPVTAPPAPGPKLSRDGASSTEDRTVQSPLPALAPPKSSARRSVPPADAAAVREIWDHYRARIQPKARVYDARKIAARLQTFSVAEIMAGIDNFAADDWWMAHNANQGADWFFRSDKQVERWVNLRPRQPKDAAPTPRWGADWDPLDSRQPDRVDQLKRLNAERTGPTASRSGPLSETTLADLARSTKY